MLDVQVASTKLAICAVAGELRAASAWLETAALAQGVPAEQITRLDVCLHEVLANAISHGGASARAAPIELLLEVSGGLGAGSATVTVSDAGVAFDPLAALPKARPASLALAEPGGLGLVMLRSFSDERSYRRLEQRNQLSFAVRWSGAT